MSAYCCQGAIDAGLPPTTADRARLCPTCLRRRDEHRARMAEWDRRVIEREASLLRFAVRETEREHEEWRADRAKERDTWRFYTRRGG